MPLLVVNNAQITCSCGTTPAALAVLPTEMHTGDEQPIATVMDFQPNVNIKPFGMCTTLANPQVAAATSAAMGTLTPQPCLPVTTSPWTPGSTIVTINEKKALTDNSKAMCAWTGQVSITNAGSTFETE